MRAVSTAWANVGDAASVTPMASATDVTTCFGCFFMDTSSSIHFVCGYCSAAVASSALRAQAMYRKSTERRDRLSIDPHRVDAGIGTGHKTPCFGYACAAMVGRLGSTFASWSEA